MRLLGSAAQGFNKIKMNLREIVRKLYPTRIVGERTEGWRSSSESEDKVAEIKRSPTAPDCKEPPQHCSTDWRETGCTNNRQLQPFVTVKSDVP